MKFGLSLLRANYRHVVEIAQSAEELGFESVWLSEHLMLPAVSLDSDFPGADHPPIDARFPVFDVGVMLSQIAAATSRIRLGTWVYLLPLRHPFVAARTFQTLDVVSGGRVEWGIGSGWLAGEFAAAEVDFASRARRLEEGLDICKRLWSEPEVAHSGEFYKFGPVAFEPKPVQRPWPPIHIGGEVDRALRRAAERGDGWIGMEHTPASAAAAVAKLRGFAEAAGRTEALDITVAGGPITGVRDVPPLDLAQVRAFEAAGVNRLIVSPWTQSKDAIPSMQRFAADFIG
jgi:probable F420-dependent oxidoreductase